MPSSLSSPSDRQPASRRGLAASLMAIGLGICSLAIALPRVATELESYRQETAGSSEIRHFSTNSLRHPQRDSSAADHFAKLAATDPANAQDVLQESRKALEAALAKAPARTRDWGFLARLGETGAVPMFEAAGAFRMAASTEGFSPNLTPWLFEIGIRLWPIFNAEEQAAFRSLTRRQWAWANGRTAEIAVQYRAGLLIATMLDESPDQAAAFLHSYNFILSQQMQPAR